MEHLTPLTIAIVAVLYLGVTAAGVVIALKHGIAKGYMEAIKDAEALLYEQVLILSGEPVDDDDLEEIEVMKGDDVGWMYDDDDDEDWEDYYDGDMYDD